MVSVIIPVYNTDEALLRRCVKSVVDQTYTDIEILLVDDGSAAETVAVEHTLAEQLACVRVLQQKNAGVSAARNLGIREAAGEYLCFVDSDDYLEPNMFDALVLKMGDECLPVCNFVHNEASELILDMQRETIPVNFDQSFICQYLAGYLGKEIAFSAWNKLFMTQILKENAISFPTGVVVGEDMIFVLWYLSFCKTIACVNQGLYHYTIHSDSAMNAAKDYLPSYCDTFHCLRNLHLKNEPIAENTLSLWALEVLTYLLTNPAVLGMTYSAFGGYYKGLKETQLYIFATKPYRIENRKWRILRWALRVGNKWLIYMLIRLNSWKSDE